MNAIETIEKYLNIKFFPYQKQLLEWIWNDGGKIYLTNPYLTNRFASLYDIFGVYLREEMKKVMTGFEELKSAYEVMKNEYGYLCKSISLPDEDNEYTKFVFEYQGFPIKHSFSYLLYESPYGENDDVEFFDSENDVSFTVSQLFAITDFVKIIQDNRDDKDVMSKFVNYLRNEE